MAWNCLAHRIHHQISVDTARYLLTNNLDGRKFRSLVGGDHIEAQESEQIDYYRIELDFK